MLLFILLQVTEPVKELTIAELIMKGGIIMIPIGILWFLTIYLFIERYLYLRKSSSSDREFILHVVKLLKESNVQAARLYAEQAGNATGFVIGSGLKNLTKPARDIEGIMESATNIRVAEMEKNLGYLGIIAGVAPMLGFIGTIVGIIHIFYSISLSDNISIGIIAGGLYEKMITSGSGLVVGVLAYSAYHFLQQKIQRFVLQIQKDVFEFMNAIAS